MMQVPKATAKERIQRALDEIPSLRSVALASQEFRRWQRNTRIAIERTFGEESPHVAEFNDISFFPRIFVSGMNATPYYQAGLDTATAVLESMMAEIEEYWNDDIAESPEERTENTVEVTATKIEEYWNDDIAESPEERTENTVEVTATKQVFVVHGRDEGTLNTVVNFLMRLQVETIVLQEKPNEGRTIIEKFEDYSQVGFAVVLCTPDDIGSLSSDRNNLKPRPRQNVVLEWGFFIGKLGRNRVCALIKDEVEIPSDNAGIVYIQLDDSRGWQMELFRELKSAGFAIDANLLFPST